MAKKQVPVSLRKPPSPEKIDDFVVAPPSSGVQDVAQRAPAEDRTPPAPVAAPAQASAPPPAEPLISGDGRALRPVTVYLPGALAERLTLHCIEQDRDMSNVIGEALEQHLQRRLGAGAGGPSQGAPPPSPGPFYGNGSFHAEDPFRWADAFKASRRIERVLTFGRALVTLWQRRPWVA